MGETEVQEAAVVKEDEAVMPPMAAAVEQERLMEKRAEMAAPMAGAAVRMWLIVLLA